MRAVLLVLIGSFLAVSAQTGSAALIVMPAPGFNITYDGNDADFFDANPPPGGSIVPNNLALASGGATAFSSGDLGPSLGISYHVAANANDGFYGNVNSWIGDGPSPGFIGIDISGGGGTLYDLTAFAFGRDNGNGAHDGSFAGTDACSGQCGDRWLGVYDIQITSDAVVSGGSSWTSIGTLEYQFSTDTLPGGAFTPYFRHQYEISTVGGGPVQATGMRIVVPLVGIGGGTAIDEIELFGAAAAVPEPSTLFILWAGAIAAGMLRRRA